MEKNHFFSRIHVEDIANILFKSLNNFKNNEIYNICDDKPSSQSEIVVSKIIETRETKSVKLEKLKAKCYKIFIKTQKSRQQKMKSFLNMI